MKKNQSTNRPAHNQFDACLSDFDLLANSIPHLVLVSDSQGYPFYTNDRWNTYTGLSLKEVHKLGVSALIHPDDVRTFRPRWKVAFDNMTQLQLTLRIKDHTGTYNWFYMQSTPVFGENRLKYWICTCTDINKQKLEDIRKDDFISIASHELKTPLTANFAYIQVLEKRLIGNVSSLEIVRRILENNIRMRKLIDELLDVSHMQTGRFVISQEPLLFCKIVEDAIETMKQIHPSYEVTITGTTQRVILGDETHLHQALLNILLNAVKYAPDSRKIHVSITETVKHVKVCIQDFGPGIPTQYQKSIFERFFRDPTNRKRAVGLGLGLYITREIVHRMKGRIWVHSNLGKGTIFCISFPIFLS